MKLSTAKAPVNIAVIKYWGKRNEELILPINDSISVTLSKDQMCAKTTVACSPSFKCNRIWLNGKEEDANSPRLENCIRELRHRALGNGDGSFLHWPLHICSENNFPTAAGLASSAAGYACLVYALGSLYGVKEDLSLISRLGSGSACRSIYGGFVQWEMGAEKNGSDSAARQIATESHWPELKVIILVVNAGQKKKSSSIGMNESVKSSELITYRASVVVPRRVKEMASAILEKDFSKFAELTMKDSNQFHAVCLDTYPPIHYMNSTSFDIVALVHAYNSFYGKNKVAYTFDAGPNACLFLQDSDVPEVMALIKKYFPSSSSSSHADYFRGLPVPEFCAQQELLQSLDLPVKPNALQYVIHTKVGSGPEIVQDSTHHLLNEQGLPC